MNCRRVIWTLLVAILFAPSESWGLLDDGVNFAADKNRYACQVKPVDNTHSYVTTLVASCANQMPTCSQMHQILLSVLAHRPPIFSEARAGLTGSVNSTATKAKAEQIVKGFRGVKSVDNQIVVLG